jgi:hypothetical protein
MRPRFLSDAQLLLKQRLGLKLGCCLQDPLRWARSSKPLPQNSLRQKLSCCLQDRPAGRLGHDPAVCADSVQRPPGESGDTCASNRDAVHAISAGCPDRPDDIQDRFGFFGGDSPNAGGAGSRRDYKQSVAAGRGKVGTAVGNSHSGGRQTKTALLCLPIVEVAPAKKKFRVCFRVLTASPDGAQTVAIFNGRIDYFYSGNDRTGALL